MPLEVELETYQKKLPELLPQQGKFVLIKGQNVVGTFDTFADAAQAGYQKFGLDEFLIKRIMAVEPVHMVVLAPWHI